jgi:hypothetical protein
LRPSDAADGKDAGSPMSAVAGIEQELEEVSAGEISAQRYSWPSQSDRDPAAQTDRHEGAASEDRRGACVQSLESSFRHPTPVLLSGGLPRGDGR